jgi:hypothetical protein
MISSILTSCQENGKPLPAGGNRNFNNTSGSYSGPPNPQLEALTHRAYTTHRSRLLDRWVEYADAEGFNQCDREMEL